MAMTIFGNKDSNLKLQLIKFIHKFQTIKSSIRLLCKCQRETDYILIIAVTDASMIYRERI